jgi:hypothetical protein
VFNEVRIILCGPSISPDFQSRCSGFDSRTLVLEADELAIVLRREQAAILTVAAARKGATSFRRPGSWAI